MPDPQKEPRGFHQRAKKIEDVFTELINELHRHRAHWDSLRKLYTQRAEEVSQFLQDTADEEPSEEAIYELSRIGVLSGLASVIAVSRLGAQFVEIGEHLAQIRKDVEELKTAGR